MRRWTGVAARVLTAVTFATVVLAQAEPLGPDMVEVRSITHAPGIVRGEVVNVSGNEVHDVRLRVLASWLWDDERNPGTDDQSWGTTVTVPGPIAPGESAPFEAVRDDPPPPRDDGHFDVRVSVAGVARRRVVPKVE